ncbi:MAG: DUF4089 domain-containing protein [Alphaproteobacteria bacterium]
MTAAFDAEAHLAHMAPVMGLVIDPVWHPTIAANLATTARMAALLIDFPLDDAVEPAPVFVP